MDFVVISKFRVVIFAFLELWDFGDMCSVDFSFVFEFVLLIRSSAKFVNSKQDMSLLTIRDLSSNADLYSKSNFFISLLYTPFKI